MRIPLTPLGLPQLLLFGLLPLLAGIALSVWVSVWAGLPFFLLTLFVLNFFRDPERDAPDQPGSLVSAADGKVANILEVDEPLYLKGPGRRIGVFLNVFNVHVNRSPCAGTVELVHYTPGKFLDARDERCSAENESNAIGIRGDDGQPILVRQVAGLIARRIVCSVKEGDRVERGQRIGMMKFGSYTEVIVAADSPFRAAVQLAQKVEGASDLLFHSEP